MAVKMKGSGKPVSTSPYAKHLGEPEPPAKYEAVMATTTMQKTVVKDGQKQVVQDGMSQDMVHPGLAVTPTMGRLRVEGARTVQGAKQYESVRLGITLEMPTETDPQSLEATYEFITEFISKKMSEALGS